MSFKEEGSVEYVEIDGKKVPVVQCEAEITLTNTEDTLTIVNMKIREIKKSILHSILIKLI